MDLRPAYIPGTWSTSTISGRNGSRAFVINGNSMVNYFTNETYNLIMPSLLRAWNPESITQNIDGTKSSLSVNQVKGYRYSKRSDVYIHDRSTTERVPIHPKQDKNIYLSTWSPRYASDIQNTQFETDTL